MKTKFTSFIGLFCVLAFNAFSGTVTSVSPSSATQGETLTISISGTNTRFMSASSTGAYLMQGTGTSIYPETVTVQNDSLLTASFFFSSSSPTGAYDVYVTDSIDGLLMLANSFLVDTATNQGINCTAGNLSSILGFNKDTITSLTLTGTIDARDFATMRDSMPVLTSIDLSGATIVDYYGTMGTAGTTSTDYPANVIPQYAFSYQSTGFGKTSLTSIILPSSATSIGMYSFNGCSSLSSITIPPSVTSIGAAAFYNCSGLYAINIPSLVASIGAGAFQGCSGLSSLVIPSSVTTISGLAFALCSNLSSITVNISTPIDLGTESSPFTGVDTMTCKLFVPFGSKALYKAANRWSAFMNIVEMMGLNISQTNVVLASDSGSKASTVISSNVTGWESSYNQSWLSVNPSFGTTGIDTVVFTAITANTATTPRVDTVTISSSAGQQIILVTQAPSCQPTNDTIIQTTCSSYTWNGSTYTVSGAYTQTFTNIGGCDSIVTLKLTVNALPMITATATPSPICSGVSSVINASGASVYSWSNAVAIASQTVSPTTTTSYTVTGTDANGCVNTGIVSVIVNPLPTITATASPTVLCKGFSSTLIASGGASYVWDNGIGATMSAVVTPTVSNAYHVTVTDVNGCVNTASTAIIVNPLPTASVSLSSSTFCMDTSAYPITVSPVATGGATGTISGTGVSGNQFIPVDAGVGTYTFSYHYTDANGCSNKATTSAMVNPLPAVTVSATATNITVGSSDLITASGAVAYNWSNGVSTASQTVSPTTSTIYNVTCTDANGCSNTASLTITVTITVLPTFITLSPTNLSISVGDTGTLASTITPINATDATVTWSSSNSAIATVTSAGIVTGISAGTATITATSTAVSTVKASVMVTVTNITTVDSSALITGIANVTGLLASSVVGTATGDYPQSAFDALSAALASAKAVDGVATTQTVVDNALDTLHVAATIFQAAVISSATITSVTIDSTSTGVYVGQTLVLNATVLPTNASQAVSWTSSNDSVATVNASGLVAGVSSGSVIITATSSADASIKATVTVSVSIQPTNVAVTGISFNTTLLTVPIGSSKTGSVTISPANATNQQVIWSLIDSSLATVDTGGTVTGVALGNDTLVATTVDGNFRATCVVNIVSAIPITSLTFDSTSLTMYVGQTQLLNAVIQPSDASQSVTWTSSNSTIASVYSSEGYITAVGTGTTTITATSDIDTSKKALCVVKVLPAVRVIGLSLCSSTLQVAVGSSSKLNAYFSPSNATNQTVYWRANDSTVAMVTADGTVYGERIDTTTITATTADGSFVATCFVTVVSGVKVTGIKLDSTSLSLTVGSYKQLMATIMPSNATNQIVNWTSSNPSITSVDTGGYIRGVAVGIDTIYVTTADGGYSAWCMVTVTKDTSVKVSSITVSPSSMTLDVGGTATLTATISPSTASNKAIYWESSDSTVAFVSFTGIVSGRKQGSATITAISEDGNIVSTPCTVTVTLSSDATLHSLTVSSGTLDPTFDSTITSYSVELPYGSTVVPTVSASTNNQFATMTISNASVLPGSSSVRVAAQDGKTVNYYTVSFTIAKVLISGISITPSALQSINIGATTSLTATVIPLNADNPAITWRSSNAAIASVDSNGIVTGVSAGTAYILATSKAVSTVSDSVAITVLPQDVVTVLQQFAGVTVTLGQTTTPYVIANYFSGTGLTFKVTSSDYAVVTAGITATGFGLVQNSAGTATITVTTISSRGATKTVTFPVTVNAPSTATSNCGKISITGTTTDVNCAGASTGSIVVSVSGGTAPYKYKWSNTRSDDKITNMPAGNYSIIVTDANACSTDTVLTIKEAAKIKLTATVTTPACGASTGVISIAASGGTSKFTYMWDDGSTIATVSNKAAGNYTVTVTDDAGCLQSQSFSLNNTNAPIIVLDSLVASSCNPMNGKIAVSVIGGTGKHSFNWNDGVSDSSRTNLASGSYNLTVTDNASCEATITALVPAVGFKQPEISLVTVDTANGYNLVIWTKETTTLIDYYSIYRETNDSGVYKSIGKVYSDLPSVFVDSNINTATASWRYRLSATDYCGNESPMSAALAEFKTINLKVAATSSAIDLTWDAYEGFDYFDYIIYRNGQEIATVPASVNSYIDSLPPGGNNYYFVAVQLPDTLNPFGVKGKADTGPFSQSLSNMAESQLTGVTTTALDAGIIVYPNPTGSYFSVNTKENAQVQVYTVSGTLVISTKIAGKEPIATNGLPAGLYIVKIITGKTVVTRSLLIE